MINFSITRMLLNVFSELMLCSLHSNIYFYFILGIFTSETRCLNCETVTSKDEDFFDLSIDVEQNTSITSCLKNFSNTETLCSDNKFQCDSCCTLQEAHVSIFEKKFFLKKN